MNHDNYKYFDRELRTRLEIKKLRVSWLLCKTLKITT